MTSDMIFNAAFTAYNERKDVSILSRYYLPDYSG